MLRDPIGEGGMGVVFLADQPALARTVAIKILHSRYAGDRDLARRLREEAVAASRVQHPGAVVVIDCNQLADGTPYIVMEHVQGCPLSQLVSKEPISIARAVDLTLQMLAVLEAAHASGVVHADVKSDNFLVTRIGNADHVTLIDFGLARFDESRRTESYDDPMVSGTPEYMAPEVILGDPPVRASDIYAVGVILYELLTGATPFRGGTSSEVMHRHLEDVVIPPSCRQPEREIPAVLDRIVLRALAKLPENRFPDVAAFSAALRGADLASRWTAGPITREDAAPPESPTRNYGVPLTRPRLARGSDCGAVTRSGALVLARRQIGDGMLVGDRTAIAKGYAALADALVHEQRHAEAAEELREGIDVLTGGAGANAPDAPKAADQLVVALAALLDAVGKRKEARRVAANADKHPTLR